MYFKGLAPARELIQRIRKRKLYKFVDEVAIPAAMIAHLPKVLSLPTPVVVVTSPFVVCYQHVLRHSTTSGFR